MSAAVTQKGRADLPSPEKDRGRSRSMEARRSIIDLVLAVLNLLWRYVFGLLAGLSAALFSAAVVGMILSYVSVFFYDMWFLYIGGPADYDGAAFSNLRYHVAKNAFAAAAATAFTFAFCAGCLRYFPNKGQIQSVVVLELVALAGLFAIADDAQGTDDYFLMYTGCGVLMAIAVLVLKFPHKVYLIEEQGVN